jgi:fission 1 protein
MASYGNGSEARDGHRCSESLSDVEKAVIGDTIPVESIEVVEKDYKAKLSLGKVTDDLTFVYALHLVKSPYSNDIKKGIVLLKELCQNGKDQRDYLFYIGLGSYRLEDYATARSYVERLLNFEPQNRQAKQLEQLINRKQRRGNTYCTVCSSYLTTV